MRPGVIVLCIACAGCPRDPAEAICPTLAEGELVITEIGGPQTGMELLDPWLEVYNASGAQVDLYGIRVRFRRATGEEIATPLVRGPLGVAPGSYTVLGVDFEVPEQPYIDYGFAADFHTTWPSTAVIDLEACDASIDQARYDSLPSTGTYSLGAFPPTATANDFPPMWCTDVTANPGSFPGSPQRANIVCP